MGIKIISTADYKLRGVKCMIYGEAGIGKTYICQTAPDPFVISAESGLLSLADVDIPAVEITSLKGLKNTLRWIKTSKEAQQFETFCIDSISDIAEVVLSEYKELFKDPRQAYGLMADEVGTILKKYRNIPNKNVYFSAKLKRVQDDVTDKVSYMPSVPGQMLLQDLPFLFDLVLAYRFTGTGKKKKRYLQTEGDVSWVAKDRSGKLFTKEKPDLTYLFNKVKGDILPEPETTPVEGATDPKED